MSSKQAKPANDNVQLKILIKLKHVQ